MGVRELLLSVLGVTASGCLGAPPDPADVELVEVDAGEKSSDGAVAAIDSSGGGGGACADAFSVAYVSQLDVKPEGGVFVGILVITALGDGVDLTQMVDDADDSVQLELQLAQPNYDVVPLGTATGKLDPASADLLIGPLVPAETWTQPESPTFQLTFASLGQEAPPPHHATAHLRVGSSSVALGFDLTYKPSQQKVAIPRAGAVTSSVCDK